MRAHDEEVMRRAFDRLGIAVLEPNVRGSAGYGKTYLQLDNVIAAAFRQRGIRVVAGGRKSVV